MGECTLIWNSNPQHGLCLWASILSFGEPVLRYVLQRWVNCSGFSALEWVPPDIPPVIISRHEYPVHLHTSFFYVGTGTANTVNRPSFWAPQFEWVGNSMPQKNSLVTQQNLVGGHTWTLVNRIGVLPWFDRVNTDCNPVDSLCRGEFSGC